MFRSHKTAPTSPVPFPRSQAARRVICILSEDFVASWRIQQTDYIVSPKNGPMAVIRQHQYSQAIFTILSPLEKY